MSTTTEQKITQFFSSYPEVELAAAQQLKISSPNIESIFLLRKGKIRMYVLSPEGESVTIHVFQPGSYFPLMLALGHSTRSYFFEAIEPSTAFVAPTNRVVSFLQSDKEILFEVLSRFSDAICGLMLRVESLSLNSSSTKLLNILIYLAETFGESSNEGLRISIPLTHENLAAWIGVQRETVSRQMVQLSEKKLIRSTNKIITILDIEALRKAASGRV